MTNGRTEERQPWQQLDRYSSTVG